MKPGDNIIRICPHSGRPILTRVIQGIQGENNPLELLCLHKDTVQEEKQDIIDWLNEYYDTPLINTNAK